MTTIISPLTSKVFTDFFKQLEQQHAKATAQRIEWLEDELKLRAPVHVGMIGGIDVYTSPLLPPGKSAALEAIGKRMIAISGLDIGGRRSWGGAGRLLGAPTLPPPISPPTPKPIFPKVTHGPISASVINNYSAMMRGPTPARGPHALPGIEGELEEQLAIEPVLAWRVWKVTTDANFEIALESVSYHTVWPKRTELEAICQLHEDDPHRGPSDPYDDEDDHDPDRNLPKGHVAPMPGCTCGVYLTKTASAALGQGHHGLCAIGVVRGWGKTIVHAEGWRVQKCYPVGLVVFEHGRSDGRKLEAARAKLEEAYAVPVLRQPEHSILGLGVAEAFAQAKGWLDAGE